MLKLLLSAFRRIVTAVTNPFRMLIVRIQRMFNINVITAKLVRPLTKKVKALITLRPQTREDYFVIGRWWIYKKLFLTLLLALCAGVFIYFTMFAPKLPAAMATAASVETDVYFNYDDMKLREFTGRRLRRLHGRRRQGRLHRERHPPGPQGPSGVPGRVRAEPVLRPGDLLLPGRQKKI